MPFPSFQNPPTLVAQTYEPGSKQPKGSWLPNQVRYDGDMGDEEKMCIFA